MKDSISLLAEKKAKKKLDKEKKKGLLPKIAPLGIRGELKK